MKTALVTGGCGFVGRHIVARLMRMGVTVTVVDNLSTGLPPDQWPLHLQPRPRDTGLLKLHVADARRYFAETPDADFHVVFHCAAVVGGRLKIDGDPLGVATDLAIDADFFNWLARSRKRPRKVIYFSSSAAYPIALQTREHHRRLAETDIDLSGKLGVPDMTYGWAKLTGEFLARHAVQSYGIDVVVYRPFSGYGEDQDFSYPFPSLVRRVAAHEDPVLIWGSGDQLRDFIYIEDVVDAVLATMDRLAPGEALNLGSGEGISFRALARTVGETVDHHAAITNDASKPEGVFSRVAEPSKMRRWYVPTVPLERGIAIVYEHLLRSGVVPAETA